MHKLREDRMIRSQEVKPAKAEIIRVSTRKSPCLTLVNSALALTLPRWARRRRYNYTGLPMLQWALLEATAACPELAARPSPALLEESTPTE